MRGGFLPPALLCAALGLALAFVPRRTAFIAAGLLVFTSLAVWRLGIPERLTEAVFLGCWASVIGTAALAYLSLDKHRSAFAYAAAVNAGLWSGAIIALSGSGRDLSALLFVILFVPGRPIVRRGWEVGLKVCASWLIAVATLSAMLTLVPTPGYVPDHME